MKERVENPAERLEELAELFKSRNEEYGSDYKIFGTRIKQFFPNGIVLATESDFKRFALLVMMIGKMSRYAQNFSKGGHDDSLRDLSVYAQMLAEVDEEAKPESKE